MSTLYDILGVLQTATAEEIKQAYRRKVKQHHPDRNGSAVAFMQVQEAYDTLINEDSKKRYDATGSTGNGDKLSRVLNELSKLLLTVVENNGTACNAIEAMRDHLNIALERSLAAELAVKRKASRLRDAASRVTVADGQENVLAGVLQAQATALNTEATNYAAEQEHLKLCQQVLASYNWKSEYKGFNTW